MESSVNHPRANWLAERAVQTAKRSIQKWSSNLSVSFGALLQRALMTHHNFSKTRGITPVENLLGRRVRLGAIADFELCGPILFSANEKTKTFMIKKGLKKSFRQLENSKRTGLFHRATTELPDQARRIWKLNHQWMRTLEASAATPSAERRRLEASERSRTSTENENSHHRFRKPVPINLTVKEGRNDDFKESSEGLDVSLLKFQRTKEKITWRTLLLYQKKPHKWTQFWFCFGDICFFFT